MVFITTVSSTSKNGYPPAQTAKEGQEMEVLIDNRQSSCEISLDRVQQAVRVILDALNCPDGELSILIVDDPQIENLNRKYLNRSGPTNVIAFSMREGEFSHLSPHLLGDVVISADTAAKEAQDSGITTEQRFNELLVHGILHLFGYDHETSDNDALIMEKKSRELLDLI